MIPLFKSHYSTGKSILTLRPKGDSKPEEPDSIVDIATDHNFQEVFLVEDNMSSFLEAYTNLSQEGIKLNYGLRLIVCNDLKEKNAESIATESKIVIFAPNQKAYEQLIKINDKACKEGFYYYPRTDYQSLQEAYESCRDLIFCIPFYDSFIHANCLQNKKCVPQFGNINPVFMLEDNDLPFDDIIAEKILEYNLNDQPKDIIRVKSCYYKNRKDFDAYMTFRCISKRTSLEKPNFEHMCSDEFCFESYADTIDIEVKNKQPEERIVEPKAVDTSLPLPELDCESEKGKLHMKNESEVRKRICDFYQVSFTKPNEKTHPNDGFIYKDGKLIAVAEVKNRIYWSRDKKSPFTFKHLKDDSEGYMITASKLYDLKKNSEIHKINSYIFLGIPNEKLIIRIAVADKNGKFLIKFKEKKRESYYSCNDQKGKVYRVNAYIQYEENKSKFKEIFIDE